MKKILLTLVALVAMSMSVCAQQLPAYAFAKADGGLYEFHVSYIYCGGKQWLRPGITGLSTNPGTCLAKWKNKVVIARNKEEAERKIRERFLKYEYHDNKLQICDRKNIKVKFEKPAWMDVIR